MIKTLMYHKVQDFDKWKDVFDNFSDVRKAAGEISFSTGTLHNEPNTAFVLNTWNSNEDFQAFVGSSELAEGMKNAGVLEAPNVIILEEISNG